MEKSRPLENYKPTGEVFYCATKADACGATVPLRKFFHYGNIGKYLERSACRLAAFGMKIGLLLYRLAIFGEFGDFPLWFKLFLFSSGAGIPLSLFFWFPMAFRSQNHFRGQNYCNFVSLLNSFDWKLAFEKIKVIADSKVNVLKRST